MKVRTLVRMKKSGHLAPLLLATRLFEPYYKLCFVVAGARCGLFRVLTDGPVPFDTLCQQFSSESRTRGALYEWLQVGVSLGVLRHSVSGFGLRSALARHIANADPVQAFLEEIVILHQKLILDTPAMTARGELRSLEDQDGELVARSSRILEPFVLEAIDGALPRSGPVRLLEIGCGSGAYMRYAADRNPQVTGTGLELQPRVATAAKANLERWGLAGRFEVRVGDVRKQPPRPEYDLVTLHNNIYYFPVEERVGLLEHVMRFLKKDGLLLLTTTCLGGGVGGRVLSLWGAATRACGRLPEVDELVRQMHEARYVDVRARALLPQERFYAFYAVNPL